MMKIALNGWFVDQPHTGSGQYLWALLQFLPLVQPDCELLVLVPAQAQLPPAPANCRWVTLPAAQSNFKKVQFEQLWVPQRAAQLGADVLHIPYWAPPLRSRVPFVVTVHDIIPLLLPEHRGTLPAVLYTSLVAAATRGAGHVIADSHSARLDILEHLRLPAAQVSTIHLGVGRTYRPNPLRKGIAEIRARYQLPPEYLLYLGGFHKRKNVHHLLGAWTWAAGALGENYPLVVAGRLPKPDGKLFYDLPRLAQELEITASVNFCGAIDEADKPALYQGATAFIFPSTYEGFGLPPLEAMACGVPTVTTDKSSLPEVVGSAAYLVPDPTDTRQLAAAMIGLTVDAALHTDLKIRGLQQASQFSWRKTANQTMLVYQQVLAGLSGAGL